MADKTKEVVIDWIFSKLRWSRRGTSKGMSGGSPPAPKGGCSGGKYTYDQRECNPAVVTICTGDSLSSSPTGIQAEADEPPSAPDDPSNQRDNAIVSRGSSVTSGCGSSSGLSENSCPSPSPHPYSGGIRKKQVRRHGRSRGHQKNSGSGSGSHHSQSNHHPPTTKRLRHTSNTVESDGSSSDISSTLEREAPDGGWGWVVVGAAFLINLIADGVTFSFGVFFPIIQQEFGASKSTTAWVGSLLAAMPLLSGPIASTLTDRFGCRKVTIVGALLATLGFILSYYATSIHMLMLTFGVITGFGLSLCYVAAVVIVAYYFDRRRSFATGLSVCGGGIGTFIFAPLNSHLIEVYMWRPTMLIVAGCFLSLCICGLLMKDLEWTKKSSRKREKVLQNEHDFNTQAQLNITTHGDFFLDGNNALIGLKSERLCNSAVCIPTFVREAEQRSKKKNSNRRIRYYSNNLGGGDGIISVPAAEGMKIAAINNDLNIKNIHTNLTTAQNVDETRKDSKDMVTTDGESLPITNNGHLTIHNNSSSGVVLKSANNLPELRQHNNPDFQLMKSYSNNHNSSSNNGGSSGKVVVLLTNNNEKNTNSCNGVVANNFTFCGAKPSATENNNVIENGGINTFEKQAMQNYLAQHTRNFGIHRNSLTYRGAVLNLKRHRMRPLRPASSCPDIISVATADDRTTPEWKAALQDLYVWMEGIFAWDHLSNTRFLLFIISNFLLYMWYDIPLTFLADNATGLGYTEKEGAMLVSAVGLFTVFGNIILGYIGDKKWANSVLVYGVCISVCGIVTGLMPCLFGTMFSKTTNYYLLSFLCGIFGLMISANYSLTPVILLQVVSLDKFTPAYGLLLLVQGIGNLIGPPLAGLLYDYTGDWGWSFWIAGGGIFISNFFILAPIYKKHQDKYEESRDKSSSRSSNSSASSSRSGSIDKELSPRGQPLALA